MDYDILKLEDIIILEDKKRRPLSTMERSKRKGNYPYYGAQEIIDYVDDYIFDGRYILLAEDGENLKSRKKDLVKIVEGKFWLNNHAHIFKVRENIDLEFLYYSLLKMDLSEYITGSTQPKLNQENMNNILVKIPKLEVQKKISKILSNIDNKIKLNNEINNNLYDIAGTIIDEEFKNNEFIKLNEVIKFIKGKKPSDISIYKKDGYMKYLTIACLNNQETTYANSNKMLFTKSDVLMVMDGASSGNVYYSTEGIVGSTLSKIEIKNNDFISEYLYFCLKKYSKDIQEKTTGSAIPHTDKEFVGNLNIPIIEKHKQTKYASFINKIIEINNQNEILSQLRDTLLPKLMNGEINLDNMEI